MPKPNYAFAKRQRDLAKKQKKDEKKMKKTVAEGGEPQTDEDGVAGTEGTAGSAPVPGDGTSAP